VPDTVSVGGRTFILVFKDLFRPLTAAERAGLRQDIEARGVVVPVVVDEGLGVIDGANRLEIAAELGFTDVPCDIRPGLTPEEKQSLALSLNENRRQLTADDRKEVAVRLRQQGMSYRAIGEKLGVDPMTAVRDIAESTVANSTVALPERVTGKDGRSRPARVRVETVDEAGKAADILAELMELPDGPRDLANLHRARSVQRREAARAENRRLVSETPPANVSVGERFQTIVIAPPWDWGADTHDMFGRGRPTYATMGVEQVRALPVGELAQDNAHLYLWVVNRSLPAGFALLESWGFRYVSCLTWCKPGIGMGMFYRSSTEHVLFGVKGSLELLRNDVGTWFAANRTGHSEKPEEFYQLVESCSPGPWLEMFARKERPGWKSWGAEVAAAG
jgi:N6-adenosine-specific RNA methylase IME4/ParB-like chromosome segregation protein Spo0J